MEAVLRKGPTGSESIAGQVVFDFSSDVGVEKVIASKQIPCGRRARLVYVGNDVDPGGENFLLFRVKVNGSPISDPLLSRFGNNNIGSVGQTFDPSARMSVPKEIPEGCLLELTAELTVSSVDGSSPAANYYAYGHMRVEYEDRD